MSSEDTAFFALLEKVKNIVVIQSDRPDGDSLASALFLEDTLSTLGKSVHLYCGVTMPEYLRFIEGWDRVQPTLPKQIDATIIVDNASLILLEKLDANPDALFIKTKPVIIADHHDKVACDIPYASLNISRPHCASAGELLYRIFTENGIETSLLAKRMVMQSILSDTLGLTSDLATAETYRLMAELMDAGVERAELEEARREYAKMDERVFRYKAELMQRTELLFDGECAMCTITEDEAYSVGTLYNPGPLILSELLMIKKLKIAIALKIYHNRATAAIRTTYGNDIAHTLAETFGGGGHPYSAGFKIEKFNGDVASLKRDIVTALGKLLQ